MGYIKHHTIIVTDFRHDCIVAVHQKAKEIFKNNFGNDVCSRVDGSCIISEVIHGLTNGQYSFFIAPDGSKEGWETSKNGDNARKQFLDWLMLSDYTCDYVELSFGGDDEYERIVRSKDTDLDYEDEY